MMRRIKAAIGLVALRAVYPQAFAGQPEAANIHPEQRAALTQALREVDALRPHMTQRAYYRVLSLVCRGFSHSRAHLQPPHARGDA